MITSPSQALRQARPHPFAATTAALEALVPGTPSTATVLLPSLRKAPLDSPVLFRITPRRQPATRPSALEWRVPVLMLDPAKVETSLAPLVDPAAADTPPGQWQDVDVRPAPSLRHLFDVARYAAELVERGRVLPALANAQACPEARWRAVLTGQDAAAAVALIAAAPPSVRAASPTSSAATLVSEALDTIADALARTQLVGSILPPRRGRRPARLPAAEAWVEALTGPDARFDADPDELRELDERLQPWADARVETPGPAQLVLRLRDPNVHASPEDAFLDAQPATAPPAADAGPDAAAAPTWELEFLLRSRTDPSLLVDAPRIWGGDGSLARWLERPREVLLTELARAQRAFPRLEAGLRQAQPSGLSLDAEATYDFLTQGATALDEAGFEVLLPAWWRRPARVGLRLSATPSDHGETGFGFGRDQLCEFRWDLAVGEHGLSDDEIAVLSAAKSPLVQLRGQWVAIDPAQLARGLEFLRSEGTGRRSAAELLTLALSHPDDLELPLPLTDVAAEGWLGDVLVGTVPDTVTGIEPPDSFTATLRPYQHRGLDWLSFLGRLGLGACLADDMGLGKTIQLLALESTARHRAADSADSPTAPTLLLCPMSLIGNWEAEAARFAPALRVHAHHGPERLRDEDLTAALAGTDIVVTTYATALNDMDQLAEVEWERVVLDEAQAIKNRLSRTAKAVRRLQAGQRIALTGTPVENRLTELWSIMDFLNPGVLGSPELFRARFSTPIERHRDDDAAKLLRRVTRPYILRRVKTDPAVIDDLPEKIEIKQHYRLTVEQASLYQAVVDEMMQRIEGSEGIERRGNVLAAMTKLKQVCNHPAQLLHDRSPIGRRSGKIIRLEDILDEILAEGDRVLCFTQYTEFAELLVPHLAARFDTDPAYLSGSTSRERRSELVERFQSGEGSPLFVLSLKAGGTGLNLTAANHVIHLDRWWNPAVEDQATDRAFRIGQKRNVQVRKFIGTGTLEERIDQMIDEKKELANMVVGDGEAWLTELSSAQLRDLFALSKDAVGE
ncbi:DEAD/DEAH box helicase [Tessaracoccus sp. Y1736]